MYAVENLKRFRHVLVYQKTSSTLRGIIPLHLMKEGTNGVIKEDSVY